MKKVFLGFVTLMVSFTMHYAHASKSQFTIEEVSAKILTYALMDGGTGKFIMGLSAHFNHAPL
jgi:hypothetical protein